MIALGLRLQVKRCSRPLAALLLASLASAQPAPPAEWGVRISATKSALRIGSEDPGPALFGLVQSVTQDGADQVIIGDDSDQSLRAFDKTGHFLARFGQRGQGPGDFSYFSTIWHDGNRLLYVLDVQGLSVLEFTGESFRFLRRLSFPQRPSGFCGVNRELFLVGFWDGKLVHVLNDTGATVRSFGERIRADTIPGVQAFYDKASLATACDDRTSRLYVAESGNDVVRAYELDGKLAWQISLPDFGGSQATMARGRLNVRFAQRLTRTVVPLGEYVLIQAQDRLARRTGPQTLQPDYGVVRTYILSRDNGKLVGVTHRLPLLHYTGGGRILGEETDPIPAVFSVKMGR